MLHNTILLCGTDFSDDPRARDPTVIERLIQQSRDELYNEAERPSLPAVQGAILLGNYLTSANQHGLGYMYTGVAIRMTHSCESATSPATLTGLLTHSGAQRRLQRPRTPRTAIPT